MPEQAEWVTESSRSTAHSDSGDYRWHPDYAARYADNRGYDCRTLADKLTAMQAQVDALQAQVNALSASIRQTDTILHRHINEGEGEL